MGYEYPNGFGGPAPETHLKADEVEKIVSVAKDNDITFTKDEYLYLCNLVFGKVPDPFTETLAKFALSGGGFAGKKPEEVKTEAKEESKEEVIKDE